jgi:hypothetical protein
MRAGELAARFQDADPPGASFERAAKRARVFAITKVRIVLLHFMI